MLVSNTLSTWKYTMKTVKARRVLVLSSLLMERPYLARSPTKVANQKGMGPLKVTLNMDIHNHVMTFY